jgi:stress-induced morphogen
MSVLQRHRAVNEVIMAEVKQLHAITLETKTPDQLPPK